jgi:hypothetical protein
MEQAARGIVETVTRYRQVRVDAPILHAPIGQRDAIRTTAQTAAPLGCRIAPAKIVGAQFVDDRGAQIRLLLDDGTTIDVDEKDNRRARRKLAAMDDLTPKRRPARVLARPGSPPTRRKLDPLGGLLPIVSEFGEIIWSPAADGASVGVLDMYEQGNTVLIHRVSGDENDTLAGQFGPTLGLCRQFPEILVPRKAIFAVNMSGTREYWPERTGGSRTGAPEREDLLLLDRWIDEGWVEYVAARDDDRIAREMIWHDIARHRWRKAGVGLWLARYGRQLDYDKDRIALGAMALVAEEERVNVTRRMQAAKIDKGPALGLGWGTKPRIGFMKDLENGGICQNLAQWPSVMRIFELADVDDANALSTARIAEQSTKEGFPITRERVRTMLQDPIYATGEWSVNMRGVQIPQPPIALENPVPIDRFQRIQDMLALRQGRSGVTPIGEFLLNYVETVHVQCQDERREVRGSEERALLKGYIDDKNSPDLRRIRHIPWVPDCCRGTGRGFGGAHAWDRDLLEPAIVTEIRRIAEHPELQRQLALAARHDVANTRSRLTDGQRREIERDIQRLEEGRTAELDRWLDSITAGTPIDRAEHDARVGRFSQRIKSLRARLDADTAAATSERNGETPRDGGQRLRDFLEIMTVETPEDAFHKQLRARLFQRVIHRVEIDDPGTGPITITLHGHLVPETAPAEASNPVYACHDLLASYATRKSREKAGIAASGEARSTTETAMAKGDRMAVWGEMYSQLLHLPSTERQERERKMALESIGWRQRITHARKDPGQAPSWSLSFVVEGPERPLTVRARRQERNSYLEAGDTLRAFPVARRVADALHELGEASLDDVALEARVCRQTARRWLRQLVTDGIAERSRIGAGPVSALYRLRTGVTSLE